MKAVIGRFYKNYKDAEKHRVEMEKMWFRRIRFFVVSYDRGSLVISESSAHKCFPDLFPKKERPLITLGKGGRPRKI